MKEIYIVTTYTGTVLSSMIKHLSKVPYAHVSISLDSDLSPMYGMGRVYARTPIIAGLVQENISQGLYALKPNTKCRVYSLMVNEQQYETLRYNLTKTWNNRKSYKYDVKALVRLKINKPKPIEKNKYVCSNFVADILDKSGINIFEKPSYMIQPKDFLSNNKLELVYEGLLSDYSLRRVLKVKAI